MEKWLSYIAIFAFGAAVGSFLNCLAYRLVRAEDSWLMKFLRGRSICPKCRHVLGAIDLVPIFSFAWLGGKCRHCRAKISWQYPIIELVTAGIFIYLFYQTRVTLPELFGIGGEFNLLIWRNWLIAAMLVVVFVVDYKEMIIPDKVILPVGAAVLVLNILAGFDWKELVIAGGIIGGFFLLQHLVSKGKWIGFGDVKFGLVLGLIFGYWGLLVLFLSYIIGGVVATVLLLWSKKGAKSQVAFGPFLVIGSMLVLLWGQEIWELYQAVLLMI